MFGNLRHVLNVTLRVLLGLITAAGLAGGVFLARAGEAAKGELPVYAPDANASRTAIPDVYTWDLSPMFPSDEAFEAGRVKLLGEIPTLAKYEGKLGDPAALVECLDLYFRLHRDGNFLTLYGNLRRSTAQSDDRAGAMTQSSLSALDELMRTAAFIRREVLALPADSLDRAYSSQPKLAAYRPYIENLRRRADRMLSPDAERVLGLLGDNLWAEIDLNELPSSLENAHAALLADIPFPKIKEQSGREVQLTLSNYPHYRASADREERKAAVTSLMSTLRQYQHAAAATLAGQFALDIAYARARGYESALAAYLDKDEIDPQVYDNLIRTVGDNTPLLHRYLALRKRVLHLPDIHLYDLYCPMVPGVTRKVPFAEAKDLIIEGLKPLGTEYGAMLARGLDPKNGWLDLYPHKGKRSGAFSSSVYGPHPWVFMNYMDSVDDMSTLAHEYGHALHSELSMKTQPYPTYRYTNLLAEIASTCNEALLSDYLIANAATPEEKAYLLVEKLEGIRGTIFRQTMFAEFERTMHGLAEAGVPLTASLFEEKYRELLRKYFGPDYTIDDNDGMEWAYIPHFYYKYYVYSYATGLTSGIAIADRVRTQGSPAAKAYLDMLRGGSSAPPLTLLQKAGVDLTKPDPIVAAMKTFQRTLDQLEEIMVPKAREMKEMN